MLGVGLKGGKVCLSINPRRGDYVYGIMPPPLCVILLGNGGITKDSESGLPQTCQIKFRFGNKIITYGTFVHRYTVGSCSKPSEKIHLTSDIEGD